MLSEFREGRRALIGKKKKVTQQKKQSQQAVVNHKVPTGTSWFNPLGMPSAYFHPRQERPNDYTFWHLHSWRTFLFLFYFWLEADIVTQTYDLFHTENQTRGKIYIYMYLCTSANKEHLQCSCPYVYWNRCCNPSFERSLPKSKANVSAVSHNPPSLFHVKMHSYVQSKLWQGSVSPSYRQKVKHYQFLLFHTKFCLNFSIV